MSRPSTDDFPVTLGILEPSTIALTRRAQTRDLADITGQSAVMESERTFQRIGLVFFPAIRFRAIESLFLL